MSADASHRVAIPVLHSADASKVRTDPLEVKGSWAGATGFPQFMPASLRWADDGNGDGAIDLFNVDDAIASVGRYLAEHGPDAELLQAGQDDEGLSLDTSEAPLHTAGRRVLGLRLKGLEPLEADGRQVALKVARPDVPGAAGRLAAEARALRQVGPPAVPAVYTHGPCGDDGYFVAMERVNAPTLSEWLEARSRPVEAAAFFPLADALLASLERLHAVGLVHRDLKPENVFWEEGPGRARLFDLGIARDQAQGRSEHTEEGTLVGSAEYMAPEQCTPNGSVDARTDLYAVAILFYELLCGHVPFFGVAAEVRQAHLSRRPPPLPSTSGLPRGLEELLRSCLAKDPQRRPQSAAHLRVALATARGELPSAPAPATPGSSAPGPTRQKRTVAQLYFESERNPAEVRAALRPLRGELAHASVRRYVAVFGAEAGEHPVEAAAVAAKNLVAERVCGRVRLEVGPLSVRDQGGQRRYLSAAFGDATRYPAAELPPGVYATATAAGLLSAVGGFEAAGPAGLFRLSGSGEDERTRSTVVVRHKTALVGRTEPLTALEDAADAAWREGQPRLATLLGEAGIGKTHLVSALAERLERGGARQVLALTVREPMAGDSDELLRLLLRTLLELPAQPPPQGALAQLSARLLPELAADAQVVVELVFDWPATDPARLERLKATPGVLRTLRVQLLGEALRRRAAERSFCLLLDDAHLAEPTVLDGLEHAALAEHSVPLFVLVAARPRFSQQRPAWGDRAAGRTEVVLGPLEPEAAASLCRQLLLPAQSIPERTVEQLVDRAQANPLLLTELVRGLKEAGRLRVDAGGAFYLATDEVQQSSDLPLVEFLAERELSALAPALAAHVRLIALLDGHFTPSEVDGVLAELDREGAPAELTLDAHVATRRLLAQGLFVAERDGTLRFRHPLLREAAQRSIPAELATSVHRAAYRYFGSAADPSALRRLRRLATHAAAAGLRDEAAATYLLLADRARERHAYVDSEALYSLALQQLSPEQRAQRRAALQGRGLMRYRNGRHADSLEDLRAARQLAVEQADHSSEAALLLDEATALDWMSEYARSAERVTEAERVAPLGERLLAARLLLGRGRAEWRQGRWEPAAALLREAAREAEGLGDAGYETWVIALTVLGFVLPYLGCADEAASCFERVIAQCEARQDQLQLAVVLNNRRNLYVARGQVSQAVDDLRRYVAIGHTLGMAKLEFVGEYNAAELLVLAARGQDARPHLQRAVELERRHPNLIGRPVALLLEARALAFEGQAEAAATLASLRAAQAEATRVGSGLFLASEKVLLEAVALSVGPSTEAEWEALLARSAKESTEQEPIEIAELAARALARQGQGEAARRALRRAERLAASTPNVMGDRLRATAALLV